MSVLLERLRPHPHRGDVLAAGALPLALAAVVIDLRMTQWGLGPRFVVLSLTCGLLLAMAWMAPLESEDPRAYHSVLLVAGLLPLILALVLLAEILGASRPPGSGGLFWIFALESAIAIMFARRANSGVCTLIASLSAAVAVEAFVAWVFRPRGLGTFRAMLVVLTLLFAAGAVRLRDRRRRHAVQLANAGGVVSLVLALTFLLSTLFVSTIWLSGGGFASGGTPGAGFGWKLFLFATGVGLVAYAAVDREPGPAYIGGAVLVSFVVLVSLPAPARGSLVGWPLFLLLLGAGGLAIGLRPRRPLPPPPDVGDGAPTVPFNPTQP